MLKEIDEGGERQDSRLQQLMTLFYTFSSFNIQHFLTFNSFYLEAGVSE